MKPPATEQGKASNTQTELFCQFFPKKHIIYLFFAGQIQSFKFIFKHYTTSFFISQDVKHNPHYVIFSRSSREQFKKICYSRRKSAHPHS